MKPNVPQVLLALFKANFGNKFRMFREGDPIIIPASQMPALVISEPQTQYLDGPTGFDEVEHSLTIQVILNKKDEFGKPSDESTSLDATLDALVQGRDESTGEFLPQTVIGILRKNYTLGNLTIHQQATVRKGVIPRTEELTTVEAHIEIVVTELQQVSGRV
jgi:hypothetical protein